MKRPLRDSYTVSTIVARKVTLYHLSHTVQFNLLSITDV
jgi:hypothetical protein